MSTTDVGDVSPRGGVVHAVGLVPTQGRGGLPDVLLHDEPLAVHASRALTDAGVRIVSPEDSWGSVQDIGLPVVLHDPLCPLTPPDFVASLLERAVASDVVQVGVRPMTDTVKTVHKGVVGATVDRDSLLVVASPVVLPARVVEALDGWCELDDFAALVTGFRERFGVDFVEAPTVGRRVTDAIDVLLLEAFEEL